MRSGLQPVAILCNKIYYRGSFAALVTGSGCTAPHTGDSKSVPYPFSLPMAKAERKVASPKVSYKGLAYSDPEVFPWAQRPDYSVEV